MAIDPVAEGDEARQKDHHCPNSNRDTTFVTLISYDFMISLQVQSLDSQIFFPPVLCN